MAAPTIAYESKWAVYNPNFKRISENTIAGTRALAIKKAVESPYSISRLTTSQKWKECYRKGFRLVRVNVNYVV